MALLASLMAASLAAASPAQAEAAPTTGTDAVRAFEAVCLANRTRGVDAALAAIQAFPGASALPDLPSVTGRGRPMKLFASGDLGFLVRQDRKGFGCFVSFDADENGRAGAAAALDGLPGLIVRGTRNRPERALDWDIAGSRDDVRMTSRMKTGGILINLEVKE